MGTTRFFLFCKKGQYLDKGQNINIEKQAVNLVYSISGERKFFRTKIRLYAGNWDQKNQKAAYVDRKKSRIVAPNLDHDLMITAKEAERINTFDIGGLRQQVIDIEDMLQKQFKLAGIQYTPNLISYPCLFSPPLTTLHNLMVLNLLASSCRSFSFLTQPHGSGFDF
jgi:hypothetical protein